MIGRRAVALAAALTAACGDAPETRDDVVRTVARRYLTDAAYRRSELEASLTTRDNDYARLRLDRYERGWERLPEWNPAVEVVRTTNHLRPPTGLAPLAISDEARGGDLVALRNLGIEAFWRYPVMLASTAVETLLRDRSVYERSGLRLAAEGALGGDTVRVALPDGSIALGYTCAACHSAPTPDGALVAGLANAALDLGALNAEANATLDPTLAARLRAWGPGRVDVSSRDAREPVATPDLRATRWQVYLQRAGAVRARSLASLAVRIETLIVTSHLGAVRPPREVALGLALYLDAMADALGPAPARDAVGAAVFASRCAPCHAPPSYAGGLVAAAVVGTERTIADSVDRGTGSYRVPSLRGVGARVRLLHDGSVAGLGVLLDPRRAGGHRYGLDLDAGDRAALQAFLDAL